MKFVTVVTLSDWICLGVVGVALILICVVAPINYYLQEFRKRWK